MKTIQIILIYALLSIIIQPLQAATYKIAIDYQHPSIEHTDSKSNIIIRYLDSHGKIIHEVIAEGIYPISKDHKIFSFSTDKTVKAVQFEIKGKDAFYIDKLTIWKDEQLLQEHGMDGGKGWCLSTDEGDAKGWAKYLLDGCQPIRVFAVEDQIDTPNLLGKQRVKRNTPKRIPKGKDKGWTYHDNESRKEINAEGLGRCYDIRHIDPINWSNETLESGQRGSVIRLVRDDSRRPARHNNKDYVVPKGVVFTSEIIGDSEAESKFAVTGYDYENEVLKAYRAGIGVPRVGSAKGSVAFKDINATSGNHSSLYAFSKMYKQFYKLDLYFDDPTHEHYMDVRFWNGVKQLGHGLSATDFIRKFGTHYAATTYYGGNFFQRRTINQSEYAYYESNKSKFKTTIGRTIKKVKFKVGTTQSRKNKQGETERVAMSRAKIYTIGGDLNQYQPELWAESVLKNLAVVKVKLTRLSDLLTTKNFPNIPNIEAKQQLLATAILLAEQEALYQQSQQQNHTFFTKKSATFKLKVTHIKCKGHGSNEAGGNSEYFGNLKMAFFNRNGNILKSKNCFKQPQKESIDLAIGQTKDINKTLTVKVFPVDIPKGYISVYGSMQERDIGYIQLSTISKHEEKAKIYFRNALDMEVKKKITFTSKYGDIVEVYYRLEKL